MDGILVIDKPAGITSHDVVGRARKLLKTKRIGHTGTLDPFATGVMILLVGKATRLARFLDKDAKEYEALVRFGYETETGDLTGESRITDYETRNISAAEIERILPEFRGEILQTPPMYSAKKIAGKKLYELARKGIEIERKPVAVMIHKLELMNRGQWSVVGGQFENHLDSANDSSASAITTDYRLKVECSAGTYIRTLAEDIGRKIGVGAHLAALRRTKAGKFDLSQAVTLENLEKIVSENNLNEVLISMNEAISHLPEMRLDENELQRIKNGMKINARTTFRDVQIIRLTDARDDLVAVGIYDETENKIQPSLVLLN